jgi:hypothetical protein
MLLAKLGHIFQVSGLTGAPRVAQISSNGIPI